MDRIAPALAANKTPAPYTAPLFPQGTKGLVVLGSEIKGPPVVVRTTAGRSHRIRMLAAEVSVIELRLLLDRAVAAGEHRIKVVVLSNEKEILTPGSEVGV